ncbi:hypothetical protein ACGFWD_44015 [Streptomyces sp. NPDC048448]|uniref:hypothetical protein n=1 Tax=Streptomyces sp. NPDC048448 TaxID=3365554 RepID=UPI003721169A
MPHPLGRLTDRPDDQGRAWVTTPHIKQLERLHRDGHLTTPVTIQDSWTGRRTSRCSSRSTPRPARPAPSSSRPAASRTSTTRPACRSHCVRHWLNAFKAVQEGHTLVALRNVDTAIFGTPDETPPGAYRVGTGFDQVKAKFIQPGPEGDD